jgi:hypothetical protein
MLKVSPANPSSEGAVHKPNVATQSLCNTTQGFGNATQEPYSAAQGFYFALQKLYSASRRFYAAL